MKPSHKLMTVESALPNRGDAAPSPGARYQSVRAFTTALCAPLAVEDTVVQSMPDVSPTKWHLAHTSWFFETFLLASRPGYREFHPRFGYLFNSYYQSVGERHARPQRGLLSRPTLAEISDYRAHVDRAVTELLDERGADLEDDLATIVELGLQHEQQHQELILTDIKHVFASNPLRPAYKESPPAALETPGATGRRGDRATGRQGETRLLAPSPPRPLAPSFSSGEAGGESRWREYREGVSAIGHDGEGFAFDNEAPRHRVFLEGFRLATQLVTNGEYRAFMEDGGYRRPELWLSDGWSAVCERGWEAPLYWEPQADRWWQMTLSGTREVDPAEPVCHVSYYEADAYARWAGARLPTEAEWEVASAEAVAGGNFAEEGRFHPAPAAGERETLRQMFGDAWEWTGSAYLPYPGYRPWDGALGEYNGKFMSGQMVLRGGSCATPRSHIRATYRNFFPPDARWQFTGIRLAAED
jgi:formylglycine-generating enzyme required for sulfatase activity